MFLDGEVIFMVYKEVVHKYLQKHADIYKTHSQVKYLYLIYFTQLKCICVVRYPNPCESDFMFS